MVDRKNPPRKAGAYGSVLVADEKCRHVCGQRRHAQLPPAACQSPRVLVLLSSVLHVCREGETGLHKHRKRCSRPSSALLSLLRQPCLLTGLVPPDLAIPFLAALPGLKRQQQFLGTDRYGLQTTFWVT